MAIYCKSNLKIRPLTVSSSSETEFIIAEISDGITSILVSCVYNPHKSNLLDSFLLKCLCI